MKVYGKCYQEERDCFEHHYDIRLKGSYFIDVRGDDDCVIGNEYSIYANLYDEYDDNKGIRVFSCNKLDIQVIIKDGVVLDLKKHLEDITFC